MTAALNIRSPLCGLVPPERVLAIGAFLARALPGERITAVDAMTGGASGALLLRLGAGSETFVLRLDGAPDGLRDPARQYACQAIAAARGLAPALIASDAERWMSLSAFVRDEGPKMTRRARLTAAAQTVQRLHAGPGFPPLLPYMQAMRMVIGHFTAAAVTPAAVSGEIADRFEQLDAVYPRIEGDVVASHCDLNPGNILYRNGQAVFVDWESAFAADRYVDVAALLNYFAADDGDAALILASYLGRPPTGPERDRARAMRQVNRLFYGALLLMAAAGQGVRATPADLARFTYTKVRSSSFSVVEGAGKIALGCAFLNDALTEMRSPDFQDVLVRLLSSA